MMVRILPRLKAVCRWVLAATGTLTAALLVGTVVLLEGCDFIEQEKAFVFWVFFAVTPAVLVTGITVWNWSRSCRCPS